MNMTKREKEFYNNLIICDEDKIRAEKSLQSKGVEKHLLIKKRLLARTEGDNIEYEKIASTYRYDKRIRHILFKYISYLEEFYRAIILDNYFNRTRQKFWIEEFQNKIEEFNHNLNDALEHIDFREVKERVMLVP